MMKWTELFDHFYQLVISDRRNRRIWRNAMDRGDVADLPGMNKLADERRSIIRKQAHKEGKKN